MSQLTNLPATTKKTNDNIITTEDADWLDQLADQVVSVVVESEKTMTHTYIKMYWEMGEAIMQEIERQTKLWERDQLLPEEEQSRNPPPSRNYIFQHIVPLLAKHEWFLGGTGRTSLYAATDFYNRCPTEPQRERLVQELGQKLDKVVAWRDICHYLLPGHQTIRIPPKTLYHGAAKYSGKAQGLGYITFEASDSLDIKPGTPIRVKITTL